MFGYLHTLGHLSHQSRDNLVTVVWKAVAYARRDGADVEVMQPRPTRAPRWSRLRQPRILSVDEVRAILAAARLQRPQESLRPATFATLFGLLFATGMRISEALAIDIGDFDREDGVLTIGRGKFGKSRVLPIRESTVVALERYLGDPKRPIGTTNSAPLFVSGRRRRLATTTANRAFRRAYSVAAITEPKPWIHDLRHSFVSCRMLAWYSAGCDVNLLLPALSTYLGHVSVENTRAYLRANGLLLEQACSLFAANTCRLDELS